MTKQEKAFNAQLCTACGHRRGLHRYGDDACPSLPLVHAAAHWLATHFTQTRGAALSAYLRTNYPGVAP